MDHLQIQAPKTLHDRVNYMIVGFEWVAIGIRNDKPYERVGRTFSVVLLPTSHLQAGTMVIRGQLKETWKGFGVSLRELLTLTIPGRLTQILPSSTTFK